MSDSKTPCVLCGWPRNLHRKEDQGCPCTCEMQGVNCPIDCRECSDGYAFVAAPDDSEVPHNA